MDFICYDSCQLRKGVVGPTGLLTSRGTLPNQCLFLSLLACPHSSFAGFVIIKHQRRHLQQSNLMGDKQQEFFFLASPEDRGTGSLFFCCAPGDTESQLLQVFKFEAVGSVGNSWLIFC